MRCSKARWLLNRYIDKELDEKKAALLEEHISMCGNCKKELEAGLLVKSLISTKEAPAAGDDFLARLQDQLKKEESEITELNWVFDTGNLAKRLIPIPVAIILLVIILNLGALNNKINLIDGYLYGSLTQGEIRMLSKNTDSSVVLNDLIFAD